MNASDSETARGRSTTWMLAAVFVTLIVIAATVVFSLRTTQSDPQPSVPADPTESPIPDDLGDGFGTPVTDVLGRRVDVPLARAGQPLPQTSPPVRESDPSWMTAPPTGTTGRGGWQRVHGVSVPFSTSDGPTHIRERMAAGYARTPRGAALAAVYITHQLAARPADPAVVDRVNYNPRDLAEYWDKVAAGALPSQQPEPVTRWIVAPDAYRIVSWSPDLVVLQTATRRAPGSPEQAPTWTSAPYSVVWTEGDWNLLPSNAIDGAREIASILGWTPW